MTIEEMDLDFGEEELKGNQPPKPGWYHLAIVKQERNEKNTAMKVEFEILDGTVRSAANERTEKGKRFSHFFQDPSPAHKDGGAFAKKMKAKLGLAAGIIDRASLGQRVQINWGSLVTKQLIAKVSEKKDEKGKVYGEIDGMEMYSVFDPAMAHVPMNQEALRLIPGSHPPTPTPGAVAPVAASAVAPDPFSDL